jgi:carboxyl-terminal processing protease
MITAPKTSSSKSGRKGLVRLALLAVLMGSAVAMTLPLHTVAEAVQDGSKSANGKERDVLSDDTLRQMNLFADIFGRTRSDYVEEVPDEKLVEAAINGMLTSLDPHSGYMNKKSFQDMQVQTRGEFGGLGLEVTQDQNVIKVVSPIDDTPAFRAGLKPGDYITHIDGQIVTEMSLTEAVDKMRGAPGTTIKLTVRRGLASEPFDVTITRAIIRIVSVKSRAEGDIGYIRITTFNEQTQAGLDKALADLKKEVGDKLVGYVLDLRNNPGGLLDQAISVSATFLRDGEEIVSTRGRHDDDNQIFRTKGGDKTGGKPIVVLINGGSASASEIVAGALQDHRRAILVGTKSFGKGSVQTIVPVSGGGAMRLTTARYYTPSGRSIQAMGIEPDIAVEPAKLEAIDTSGLRREADLKGALKNDTLAADKAASAKDKTDKTAKKEEATEGDEKAFDYQLARAMDLLRGVSLYEARFQRKAN